jgi:hypothetical protein
MIKLQTSNNVKAHTSLMRKNFKILRLGIGEAGATTTGATYKAFGAPKSF